MGIAVKNYDDTIALLQVSVGTAGGVRLKTPDGGPLLTYLQVSRDTFLEVQPATATLPPGLTHFAIEYGDLRSAVAQMRQHNVAADPGLTPGKALISRIRDLDGVSIEVMEFGPESMQKKAMDAWRP